MKRPFVEILKDLRFGELSEQLNEAINKVVLAVENTGKVGELTSTLKLKPSSSGAIEVIDSVKSKVPELQKDSSLFCDRRGQSGEEQPASDGIAGKTRHQISR